MEAVAEKLYSLEEYFAFCETHEGRFEFVDGEIIEMSGETITANQIAGNIHFHLRRLLGTQSYLFLQNATKVQVEKEKIFRIPDFFICEEKGNARLYSNSPLLIVEVLSESSGYTDRVIKLREYCSIASFQYYLIVAQSACYIELYRREGDRWYVEFYDKMDQTINLPFFKVGLPVSEIFEKVEFEN